MSGTIMNILGRIFFEMGTFKMDANGVAWCGIPRNINF
jgi:hypothetical protein